MNCAITKDMKYNMASANFFQLRDPRVLWGLNFGSKDEGALFSNSIKYVMETLANGKNKGKPDTDSEGRFIHPRVDP